MKDRKFSQETPYSYEIKMLLWDWPVERRVGPVRESERVGWCLVGGEPACG